METFITHARGLTARIADRREDRERFGRLAEGQSPQALFITCSDSRVVPSLITGARPGELFELRTAGNIVPPHTSAQPASEAATIEYAVEVLGVADIVVCGHSHCGAVGALVRGDDLTAVPAVRDWLAHCHSDGPPARTRTRPSPRPSSSHVLDPAAAAALLPVRGTSADPAGQLLHGWFYEVHTGAVLGARRRTDAFRRCEGRAWAAHRKQPNEVPPSAAGLRRLPRRLPRRRPAVRRRGRRLRRARRTRAGHRHRRRPRHRLLPGSSLQVSGPAAGLTVLVFEAVQRVRARRARAHRAGAGAAPTGHGRPEAGALVPGHLGRRRPGHAGRYRAGPDRRPALRGGRREGPRPRPGQARRAAGPGRRHRPVRPQALAAFGLGAGTIAVLVLWKRLPSRCVRSPAPLAAVALATLAALVFGSARRDASRCRACSDSIQPPGFDAFGELAELGVLGTVLAFALIASAESLFSAAAVDRLHDGPRTELRQGADGAGRGQHRLRAARRAADDRGDRAQRGQRAGGRADEGVAGHARRLAAAVRGAAARPRSASFRSPALAGVLVHAGWKLIPLRGIVSAVARAPGRGVILVVTAAVDRRDQHVRGRPDRAALAVAKTAWEASHVQLEVIDKGRGPGAAYLSATRPSCGCRRSSTSWRRCPRTGRSSWTCRGLRHLDHACRTALENWAEQHKRNLQTQELVA